MICIEKQEYLSYVTVSVMLIVSTNTVTLLDFTLIMGFAVTSPSPLAWNIKIWEAEIFQWKMGQLSMPKSLLHISLRTLNNSPCCCCFCCEELRELQAQHKSWISIVVALHKTKNLSTHNETLNIILAYDGVLFVLSIDHFSTQEWKTWAHYSSPKACIVYCS